MVAMMLAPLRLDTSRTMAGWPLIRAKPVGSLKVRWMLATSPKVTTLSPTTLIGSDNTSCRSSMTPGTFMLMRPAPVSRLPAATRRLLRLTRLNSSL